MDRAMTCRGTDTIVTTICTSVTTRDRGQHNPRAPIVSPDAGEAKPPASRRLQALGAGAALTIAVAACSDPTPPAPSAPTTATPRKPAADPGAGDDVTSPTDMPVRFGDAVLGELMGDRSGAREAYLQLIGAQATPPAVVARANLRLAHIESPASVSFALDLARRAQMMSPTDPVVVETARRLDGDLVLVTGTGDISGPRPGTPLVVSPDAAAMWARAEARLEYVSRLPLYLNIYTNRDASMAERESKTTDLVNAYDQIAAHGCVAYVAAHYRIASLYAALASAFADARPPGELLDELAREIQAKLNYYRLEYIGLARRKYDACIAAPQSDDSVLWRVAAETDLRILDVVHKRR